MNPVFKRLVEKPILILIAVNILIGLLIFRDYGTAWDEPLFYSYGDALGYAYSPSEWFSGDFDMYRSYGASGGDHRNRGPAYLLLARNFVYGLEALGSGIIPVGDHPAGNRTSTWHLVNFLAFQFGVYLLHRFARRWMKEPAAFFTAVFFSLQPLLWGHAFINPKDPPFLTFFLASVCFGFEMVDAIDSGAKDRTKRILLASFFLGIATSIRVLGPFAGLLVFLYFLSKQNTRKEKSAWRSFILYGMASVVIMFVTWPYLWENPFVNFFGVLRFMSDNPTQLGLLFEGKIYRANNLPLRYFPFMFATTLTEPVLPLSALGMIVGFGRFFKARGVDRDKSRDQFVTLVLILLWFVTLAAYIFIRRPAMYDGIRHFLFILPPVFVFIGLAFEFILEKMIEIFRRINLPAWTSSPTWLGAGLTLILLVPGLYGIIKLHPYQYTYYNFYIGGTSRAYQNYETDYWLTCYKDAVQALNERTDAPARLIIKREAYLAEPFANKNLQIIQFDNATEDVSPGDFVLSNSRTNDNLTMYPRAPIVTEISRVGAKFCTIRQIP